MCGNARLYSSSFHAARSLMSVGLPRLWVVFKARLCDPHPKGNFYRQPPPCSNFSQPTGADILLQKLHIDWSSAELQRNQWIKNKKKKQWLWNLVGKKTENMSKYSKKTSYVKSLFLDNHYNKPLFCKKHTFMHIPWCKFMWYINSNRFLFHLFCLTLTAKLFI